MDEPSKGLDKETSRDLNKAVNMGIASLVGAIIPIIGLLLAIIALVMGSNVPKNKHTEGKKRTVTTIAVIGIVLSLLSGAGYYAYYHNVQKQAEADRQAQAQQVQQAQQAQEAQKYSNKLQLDTCLGQADTGYNQYLEVNAYKTGTDSSGQKIYYMYQPQWDYINGKVKTDKDECYRRYPSL
jgi:ABC-type transport system involved in cytochrome bd biosynthesis fused ATPase/permease subunit